MSLFKDSIDNQKLFNIMQLPPYSCQMNTIELLFGTLKKRIVFNNLKTNTKVIKKLTDILINFDDNLIQKYWNHLLH